MPGSLSFARSAPARVIVAYPGPFPPRASGAHLCPRQDDDHRPHQQLVTRVRL